MREVLSSNLVGVEVYSIGHFLIICFSKKLYLFLLIINQYKDCNFFDQNNKYTKKIIVTIVVVIIESKESLVTFPYLLYNLF